MKLDIFPIEKFIKANDCPQVSNPVFFNSDGTPTVDGLFSYELFGYSDDDRKSIFGYVDLKNYYLHPLIYLILMKRMGSLGKVVTGEKYAVIADKKIKIVPEDFDGAETGMDFLYDHFNEIDWFNEMDDEEIDSIDKRSRLKFLQSLKRDDVFTRYWLIIPPYYRDESSTNKSMGDSINKLYKELLSRVKGMNLGYSFDIFGSESRIRIQNILKDIYLSSIAPISGKNLILQKGKTEGELKGTSKNSMLRRHLLGKTVEWGVSSVMTSPQNSAATQFKDKPVPFGYGAFPLAILLSTFNPFFLNSASDMLESMLLDFKTKNATRIKRIDLGQFNPDVIEKMIKSFIKDINGRFDPIEFTFIDNSNSKQKYGLYIFEKDKNGKVTKRFFTKTDLFYIIAMNVLTDKHMYITRFPVANYQNIYPSKIKVLSTVKTRKVSISFNDEEYIEYEKYPVFPSLGYNKIDSQFFDVTFVGNAYLASLNGDYDGDTVFLRGVFTEEANTEAEKLIWNKTNFFNAQGKTTRSIGGIGKECILGLYELTKSIN